MGAQSDFISETFVSGDPFRKDRVLRTKVLIASGMPPEETATMLSMPLDQLMREISD